MRCLGDDAQSVAEHRWLEDEKFKGVRTTGRASECLADVVAADGSQLLTGHWPIEVYSWIELEPHPGPPCFALNVSVHPQASDGDAAHGGQTLDHAVLGFHSKVLVPAIASRMEETNDFARRLIDSVLLI